MVHFVYEWVKITLEKAELSYQRFGRLSIVRRTQARCIHTPLLTLRTILPLIPLSFGTFLSIIDKEVLFFSLLKPLTGPVAV